MLEKYKKLFRALGSQERLTIIQHLIDNPPHELNVTEAQAVIFTEQTAASYHLNLLHKAGVLTRVRRKNFTYYTIDTDSLVRQLEKFIADVTPE